MPPSRGLPDEWVLYLPWYRGGVLYAVYEFPEERAGVYESPLYVAINPYTAEVMGHYYWGETAVSWIYNLHSFLQAGPTGMTVVGIVGIVFLLLALSVLYLWWPVGRFSRRQFTFTLKEGLPASSSTGTGSALLFADRADRQRVLRDHDRVPGACRRRGERRAPMNAPLYQEGDEPPASVVQRGVRPITIDEAIVRTREIFPVGELRTLYVPGGPQVALGVTVRQPGEIFDRHYPNSEVRFDQYTGEVLRVIDPMKFNASRRFMTMSVPFHGGEALGQPGRWLLFVAGFLPLLFFVTGLRRWLRGPRFEARQAV